MNRTISFPENAGRAFKLRWSPSPDVLMVIVSWLLVSAILYMATDVVGRLPGGGWLSFGLIAFLGATLFGIGLPVYWVVIGRRRPLADLGLHTHHLKLSLVLQLVLLAGLYRFVLINQNLPGLSQLVPMLALSLALGFFEAVFWRGWVLLRLEESFGLIPALVLSALMFASYQIGFGLSPLEIVTMFFLGLIYAAAFRLTKSVFVLWPGLLPLGQLAILLDRGMNLSLASTLAFLEVLGVMLAIIWLADRYTRQVNHHQKITPE